MTEHPITPPPELVEQWYIEATNRLGFCYDYVATQAARWGADRARAALADEPAVPAPPADGEVAELVEWLRDTGDCILPSHLAEPQRYKRAAELLQRQAPVPVPVSERLPEFSDCNHADLVWCWSWAIGTWRLGCINRSIHSHWLPAQALPQPEVDE